jgi:hypothetical protein
MSDESNTPDERRPREEPQQPGTPEPAGEPFEAEPEGGPLEREREFLRERIAQTRSRSQAGLIAEIEPAPIPIPLEPESQDEAARKAWSALAEQRRQALNDFRQLRAQKLPSRRPEEGAELLPREAPIPPPADNWIPIGPSVLRQGQGGVQPAVSGRTPAIAVAPGGTRVYVGAANGGVWRSDDTGQTWRSLMDAFDRNPADPISLGSLGIDSLAVGAIAIDPSNPDRIFVGTGEGAGGAYFGVGPVVSLDGGNTWNTEALPDGKPWAGSSFYALAMDPGNPDRLLSGSRQGIHRREPDGSGGFHWVPKSLPDRFSQFPVTSVVAAQAGGETTFYAAALSGPVYSSPDGHTWAKVGTGFPTGRGRISLAVQPNNPNVLYALDQNGSVHRLDSTDGNWRNAGVPAGFLPTYDGYSMAIAITPDNVNRIYLGGGTISSDGDYSGALYRCEVTINGTSVSMASTYIGGSVHPDIHALVFAPGDPHQLWVGCDGGVFFSPEPSGDGHIFRARNTGLQTLTMNHLGPHPTEEAVLFAATQDNGGERFTGEEAWLYSAAGDAGYAVVHWMDPSKILFTYTFGSIALSSNGGQRYSYHYVHLPFMSGWGQPQEPCLFYAPLAGTPPNPDSPTAAQDADLVAFGSMRPWISTTFGETWKSIPTNTLEGDQLDQLIRSLVFASPNRLYAGTTGGSVYRFDRSEDGWTRTRIDSVGDPNLLPPLSSVTDIAVDPSNPDRIYITFGSYGDYRRVWLFDGTKWEPRSGPETGSPDSLLNVQANAIVVDPADPAHLYVGTDIGVWRSTDGGLTWEPFSEGLPDAAVTDMVIHHRSRLLRAATHGRGVWERDLADTPRPGIQLYVRDTQLDQGRFPTVNGLQDPTLPDRKVYHWRGPDIKLDMPDVTGQYQFPPSEAMDFYQFVDRLKDFPYAMVHSPIQATPNVITRVYVQVHNRGILPANDVRVMLLAANASAGLPPLPAGYDINVRMGMPIQTEHWRTVGIVTLNDVRVGMPKIAAFNLTSNILPPPANPTGNNHPCVLALIHHPDDPYTSTITHTDANSLAERKAAHKNLALVQYISPLPTGQNPAPIIIPFRIHNGSLEQELLTGIRVQFGFPYPGLVRLYAPPLQTALPLEESIHGLAIGDDLEPFRRWAEEHIRMIRENLASGTPYDAEWSLQRIQAIERILDGNAGLMFKGAEEMFTAEIHGLKLEANSYRTFFLVVDAPAFPPFHLLDIMQTRERPEEILGGLSVRLEPVSPQET